MLDIAIIGLGNCGSQVAAVAQRELNIPVLAINSSERDTETLPESVPRLIIGSSRGAGKSRKKAKEFLKEDLMKIVNDEKMEETFGDKDIIFIVSSTGGGTGSGVSVLFAEILSQISQKSTIIIVGVLPTLSEGKTAQLNTIEYLDELSKTATNAVYMLYDNDRYSNLSSPKMMNLVNNSIVRDISVIMGKYQYPAIYNSIDEEDMLKIVGTPGRILVVGCQDIKEKDLDGKDIEDMLIHEIKFNTHAEIQRDKIARRIALICNLHDKIQDEFNSSIPKVMEFITDKAVDETFEHNASNADKSIPNNVFLIISGLTMIVDRIDKINERIQEIEEAELNKTAEEFNADRDGIKAILSSIQESSKEDSGENTVDLKNILNKFGI